MTFPWPRPPLRLAQMQQDGLHPKSHEEVLPNGTYMRVWRYWEWPPRTWATEVVAPDGEKHYGRLRFRIAPRRRSIYTAQTIAAAYDEDA